MTELLLAEWRRLVNVSAGDLEAFLQTPEGRGAGLSREEATEQGIRSGQDSARAVIRMKRKLERGEAWSAQDWEWARRQVAFIKRMSAGRGPLLDPEGRPTRRLLSLWLWGHHPEMRGNAAWLPNGTRSFSFWTDCVGMPGGRAAGDLVNAIKRHPSDKQVSYETFVRHVDLKPLRDEGHPAMYRISARDNWSISFHRSKLPTGAPVYYFAWSGIEHFFVQEEPDVEQELAALDAEEVHENPRELSYTKEYWWTHEEGFVPVDDDHEETAIEILSGRGGEVEINIDVSSQLLRDGAVRIYHGSPVGGTRWEIGLDVWELDRDTLQLLQTLVMQLKAPADAILFIDVSSEWNDARDTMTSYRLPVEDFLQARSRRDLSMHQVQANGSGYLEQVKRDMGESYGEPTTWNTNEAGFLLADGTWLKMGHGTRGDDHRIVAGVVRGKAGKQAYAGSDWPAAVRWMQVTGSIRWMPESCSFDIFVKPTAEQMSRIYEMIRRCEQTWVEMTRGKRHEEHVFERHDAQRAMGIIERFWSRRGRRR